MKLGNIFKIALKLAPVIVPAAPLVIAGAKAAVRSQKKGGSLGDELPLILAGMAAAKEVADAVKARKAS